MSKKAWNDRLRELRKDNELNQEQIARIIGTSQQYYSDYESGKRLIPIDRLMVLCDFYKVTSDYILFGKKSAKE